VRSTVSPEETALAAPPNDAAPVKPPAAIGSAKLPFVIDVGTIVDAANGVGAVVGASVGTGVGVAAALAVAVVAGVGVAPESGGPIVVAPELHATIAPHARARSGQTRPDAAKRRKTKHQRDSMSGA
jgi:hypothetical protein